MSKGARNQKSGVGADLVSARDKNRRTGVSPVTI